MKTIGLLGGMAWLSTLEYYRLINTEVEKNLSNQHSAKCILYSYDFYAINPTLRSKSEILQELSLGIQTLSDAKVDFIVLCSNTMHSFSNIFFFAPQSLPLLSFPEVYTST